MVPIPCFTLTRPDRDWASTDGMAANHNYDRYVETCLHNDNVEIMKWKEHRNRMWGPIVSSFTNTSNYIGFNCHIKPAQVMKQLRKPPGATRYSDPANYRHCPLGGGGFWRKSSAIPCVFLRLSQIVCCWIYICVFLGPTEIGRNWTHVIVIATSQGPHLNNDGHIGLQKVNGTPSQKRLMID